MQGYERIYNDMKGYARIRKDMQGYERICKDSQRYARMLKNKVYKGAEERLIVFFFTFHSRKKTEVQIDG